MGRNIPKIDTYEIQNELHNYETHTTESHSRMLAGEGIAKQIYSMQQRPS
jgi:hypothetical protein